MGFGAVNIDVGGILGGLGKIGGLFKDIRTAITGKEILDPNAEAEIQQKILEIESLLATSQNKVNEIEAQHKSMFVAGWRPYIGWILGTAIGVYFLPIFIIGTYLWARQVLTAGAWIAPPDLGIGQVIALVGSMLGFAGLRTFEKYKGVHGRH